MSTYTVARSLAASIYADTAVQQYCSTNWGRALRVCLDQLGEVKDDPALPAAGPFPYCVVGPSGDDDGGNERGEQTREIGVLVVIDAGAGAGADFVDASKPKQETDGVWTVGAGPLMAGLVDLVQTVIRASKLGSVPRGQRVVWNGIDQYPIQFAAIIAEFYEAKVFGDW